MTTAFNDQLPTEQRKTKNQTQLIRNYPNPGHVTEVTTKEFLCSKTPTRTNEKDSKHIKHLDGDVITSGFQDFFQYRNLFLH